MHNTPTINPDLPVESERAEIVASVETLSWPPLNPAELEEKISGVLGETLKLAHELVERYGVQVRRLSSGLSGLFRVLNQCLLPGL